MKIYLVGGAVRDALLSLPVNEKDWLVVGATPELMLSKGYKPVGKDFPVFLHPQSQEEYALARTEKKQGYGYGGFIFHTSPEITLEQDLYRRDLTINAIAKDSKDQLIDPYHGRKDLDARILRHVSPAFTEDPLRVLRVARFAARFSSLGFTIAPETMELMQKIAASGELTHLSHERVWQETYSALSTSKTPDVYFKVLYQCHAMQHLFPELLSNYQENQDISQCPPRKAMNLAAENDEDKRICFCCGFIPWHLLHTNSNQAYQQLSAGLLRLKIPNEYKDMVLLVVRHFLSIMQLSTSSPEALLQLLEQMDAFRRKERFMLLLSTFNYLLEATDHQKGQVPKMQQAMMACQEVNIEALIKAGFSGKTLGNKIKEVRIEKIKAIILH